MNFREFICLDSHDRDRKTGKMVEHREKYRRIIEKLGGISAIQPYIPYSVEELREAYKKDAYFNSLSMRNWDIASGFWTSLGNCERIHGAPILRLYARHGVTLVSNAESVCVLKEAARMLVEAAEAPPDMTDLL